ncbi:MAG: NADPH2:quinone reductase [Verrucomicrobiales bacterium]|jgi:NADPH2:quinone reductase
MRAVLSTDPGGPETLTVEDVPDPEAVEGHVVIDVKAASVNFPDVIIIQDLYQVKPPRPFSPGSELAGVVSEVGTGVDNLSVGDRVLAVPGHGAMAERVAVHASLVRRIPDAMTFEDAGSFLLAYGTSYHALKQRGRAKEGETLFVMGAAGGVGLAAVQLGKAMGLTVIAGCSSQEKVDLCLGQGADSGIVYPRQPLDRDQQKELSKNIKAAGGGGVDIIYDAVGGDYAEPAVRALNWEGRFLVVGFPAGIPKLPLNLTLLKSADVVGVFWGAFTMVQPDVHETNVAELLSFYEQGKIKPLITDTYPLERAADAIAALGERRAKGKIVVIP